MELRGRGCCSNARARRRLSGAVLLGVLLAACVAAGAQSGDAPPVQDADAPAELRVANRPIVTLRAPVLGVSPADRVMAIEERVDAILARGGHAPVVTISEAPGGYVVKVNGESAFLVLDEDADPEGNRTSRELTDEAARNLGRALSELNEARNARVLLPAIGWSLLATLLLGLVLWGLARTFRAIARRVRAAFDRHTRHYTGWQGHLLGAAGPAPFVILPLRLGGWLLALLLIYGWAGYVLRLFPYTRPWGEELRENLLATLGEIASSTLHAIPGLLFVTLIFVLARFAARVLRAFFEAVQNGRLQLGWVDQTTAQPTGRLFSAVIWLFALVAAYPYVPGSGSEAFKGIGVFIGLMLSIGSSGIVNQAVSGLMLMYTRSLRPGEFVQIGDTEGTVKSIGFVTTRIETVRNEEISIPNAVIAATVTRNYSRLAGDGGVRIATSVTIGYDTPWRQVHAMLQLAAERTMGAGGAGARVLQTALHDFYVEYTLLVTIKNVSRRILVLSELHAHILDVFNENGVQIMSPNYEADPANAKVVASSDWFRAPARRDGQIVPESGEGPVE